MAGKQHTQKEHIVCFFLAFSLIIALLNKNESNRVLAHSAESGENLWILDNVHAQGVTALVLSHNRRFILTGGPQGEVRLWELRTRELISHLKEHKQKITSMKLFQDDTFAVSGSRDRCILRWDLRTEVSQKPCAFYMIFFNGSSLIRNDLSVICNEWVGLMILY